MIASHPAWAARRKEAVDRHIGNCIRERRILLGMTQSQLANTVGVSYQQIYKYEVGINRIGCSTLFAIAETLGVEVAFFYDGIGAKPDTFDQNARQRLLSELARNFVEIRDPRLQEALCDITRSLRDAVRLEDAGENSVGRIAYRR
ncbi:MAG: helix-turn-helix transcriptional regulator [Geminicoccaceae bacterium]